jgi:aldehyde:ferredoxin oxidoreductase
MIDWFGYTGNILDIDLTENRVSIVKEDVRDLKRFIGGFGMNCKLFADRFKSLTDPFSSKNLIIFGTGPLVGTIVPGASRTVAISKFPATGAVANSCGSMSFGFNLKQAGFDHIIITGKSEKPVYLHISDDYVELCKAKVLWGKDIVETTDFLKKKHGSSGVIAIGQAGENLVKSSMTLIDKTSTLGRGGLGAIMGSKNLKAVLTQGTKGIPIAEPKKFTNLYKSFIERIRKYPHRDSWIELGMLRSLPVSMFLTAKGQKKKARQCSDRIYLKKMKERRIACPSCPMADKDILKIGEGEFSSLINYTSSIINPLMMLTVDGINTYDRAIKLFDLISRYGLDSLTMTAIFEFISKMNERDILTNEKLGFEWKRDYKTFNHLIEIITRRDGFGDLLADGWKKLAKENKTLSNEMLTVKGLDVVFEPRFLRLGTMEFEQVVNPKGAHVASGGSPTYVGAGGTPDKMKSHFNRMGIPETAFSRIFDPPKIEMGLNVGRLTRYSEDWYTILTSLGLCARAQMNRFYSMELVTDLYNLTTGFNLHQEELRQSAERSWNLMKLMNLKEGFSRKDDKFPSEWFKPLKMGDNLLKFQDFYGEVTITQDIANKLLDDYYDERGWDKQSSYPTVSKIEALTLDKYI